MVNGFIRSNGFVRVLLALDKTDVAHPEDQPLIIVDSPMSNRNDKEKMLEWLFEAKHFKHVSFQSSSALVLTALRKTSGVVLDCGEGVCTVSAISNGFYLQGAQHRLPFGGRDITKFLIKTMFEAGYNFSSSSDFDIAREIKEDLSFVSDDYNADIQRGFKESPFPKAHTLPDGSIIELGVERFCCVEGFFHPNLLGYENGGIQDAILQAIMSCGVDVRSTLMKNIILTGGSTLSENFANRLQNELNEAVSEGANEGVDLFTVHAEKNRELLQWIGGSLLAKSARDQIGWITREKYSEYGNSILYR